MWRDRSFIKEVEAFKEITSWLTEMLNVKTKIYINS